MSRIFVGWIICDEDGVPLRNGLSFNSEDEAWRCYFSNRSGWEQVRDLAVVEGGYTCRRVTLEIKEN